VTSIALGFITLLGAAGAGQWLLTENTRRSPTAWAHAIGAGILSWGLLGLPIGLLGLLTPTTCAAVLTISLLGLLGRRLSLPIGVAGGLMLATVALAPGILDVMGPIIGADERYLHVGLPLQMLMENGLVGGVLHPNGSRPLTLQLAYTFVLSSGVEGAAAGLHWALSVATLAFVVQLGRAHFDSTHVGLLAAAVLVTSMTFFTSIGQAASDIPAALAVLLAMDAARRGDIRPGAIAGALALSIKYTAAAPLLGILLCAAGGWPTRLKVSCLALAAVAPWWLRNIMEGHHALFPFMGWPDPQVTFQYLAKYGAGRTTMDFLWLPWRMIFEAETDSYRFLGRIHPYTLMLLGLAPLAWRSQRYRPWLLACALGLCGWASGPHWLRYLIPTLPLLALTGAALAAPVASTRLRKLALWAGLALGTGVGSEGVITHLQQAHNGRKLAGQSAIDFCNQSLPSDARIAMLFAWSSADIDRAQLLGSVEDHVPTRHFLLANTGRELDALRETGATHVLVRHVTFLPSSYFFLDRSTFSSEFIDPIDNLNHALLMGADLLFRTPTHRVYRIGAPQ